MATLDGEGLHKPQDIMMSPWALQTYDKPHHDLPTTFDIDYQNLSLLLQEAAILYHPQCAKPKLYPTIQPYIPVPPVTVTTPVVSVPLRSVEVVTKEDPYYSAEGNRSVDQGPTHTTTTTGTDYREYDTSAVPLRQAKHKNKLPFLATSCGTAIMSTRHKTTESSWSGIKPAVLLNIQPRHIKNGFTVRTLEFQVPLDHHHHPFQNDSSLKLHAELVDSFPNPIPSPNVLSSPISAQKPFILYLCGGPGDGNPSDRVPELNKFCIERGYQVLYVHYRGTGLSPLFSDSTSHKHKVMRMSDQDKADYLAKFRQDNIVRDLEAIRLCLNKHLSLPKGKEVKWTLIGQSFGGWISTTYLSFLPSSLEAVYISAGMPPLGKTAKEVYEKTYAHIVRRNEDYFNEYFPEDQEHVRIIVEHLRDEAPLQKGVDGNTTFRGYALDAVDKERKGSYLTYQTFMTLGRTFGSAPVVNRDEDDHELPSISSSIGALTIKPSKSSLASSVTHTTDMGTLSASYRSSATSFTTASSLNSSLLEPIPEIPPAYAKLHNLITHLISDLSSSGSVSQATLTFYTTLESFALHRRPLYALLHEAIYCSSTCPLTSQPSSWAATDVALNHPSGGFSWLASHPSKVRTDGKVYFTGETLHPPFLLSSLGGDAVTSFLGAAKLLAQKSDWPALYDLSSLRWNEHKVKVRAVAYKEDMYVDLELSKQAAGMVGRCELVICPYADWGHGSIKEKGKGGEVLGWLFNGV